MKDNRNVVVIADDGRGESIEIKMKREDFANMTRQTLESGIMSSWTIEGDENVSFSVEKPAPRRRNHQE